MKILCLGMNYATHNNSAKEALLKTEEPIVFLKADSCLLKGGKPFFVPDDLGRIDFEAEVVVRISRLGKSIPERFAHRYYDALTLGIDFTAYDVQRQLAAKGWPLDLAKNFDGSAAIGEWVPVEKLPLVGQLPFHLDINGQTVQDDATSSMLHTIDATIAYLSRTFTLKTGDLLFTGTPAGSGPVHVNDHLEGWLKEQKVLDFYCK